MLICPNTGIRAEAIILINLGIIPLNNSHNLAYMLTDFT